MVSYGIRPSYLGLYPVRTCKSPRVRKPCLCATCTTAWLFSWWESFSSYPGRTFLISIHDHCLSSSYCTPLWKAYLRLHHNLPVCTGRLLICQMYYCCFSPFQTLKQNCNWGVLVSAKTQWWYVWNLFPVLIFMPARFNLSFDATSTNKLSHSVVWLISILRYDIKYLQFRPSLCGSLAVVDI